LFADSFKLVNIPFSFLEAIGQKNLNTATNIVQEKISNKLNKLLPKIKNKKWPITNLPDLAFNLFNKYFLELDDISPEKLINKAKNQLRLIKKKNKLNPVFEELALITIQSPIDTLKNTESSKTYHEQICMFLALEYIQKMDYYAILKKIYPDKEKRKNTIKEIFDQFFFLLPNYNNKKLNVSCIRAADTFLKNASNWAHPDNPDNPDNPYKNAKYHGKDLLDTYYIHFLIAGYFFKEKNHKVIVLTHDNPEKVKMRLKYGLTAYHWINNRIEKPFSLNLGTVCCLDNKLNIIDKIEVDKLEYQKLNEENY